MYIQILSSFYIGFLLDIFFAVTNNAFIGGHRNMIKFCRIIFAFLVIVFLMINVAGCSGSPPPSLTTPAVSSTTSPAPTVEIQWLGQSCFLITSSQGTRILTDPPVAGTGYVIAPMDGVDVITVSHEHTDHSNVSLALGSPLILRGLTSNGWNTVDQRIKDVHIYSVSTAFPIYHDNVQGAQRGRNAIFILEFDGLRIAHLGDLGHILATECIQTIGTIDATLIPVGGVYTLDAAGATQVVSQLNPKIVIPMHYKTNKVPATWPGTGVEPFLEGKAAIERPNSSKIKLSKSTLPVQTTVVVLNPE